jgi:GNAT superfamily N-acetyltransferase
MQFDKITINDLDRLSPLQPPDWGSIIPAFKYYIEQPFCFPVKTTVNGDIAGIGAAIILDGTGWLAHIIVHPGHRNKGIGGAVTSHLMEITRGQNCRTVSLIATDLGRPVYLKHGFADQEEYLFFEREAPLEGEIACSRIRSFTEGDRGAVLELDRRLSGESRERLLHDKLQGSYIHLDQGKVDGYYLPELGEGLVMAGNQRAGLGLLRLKLSRSVKNVLPGGNKAGAAFMLQHGYRETKRAKRMVWGEGFPWCPEHMFGRIAGNLG